MSKRGWGCSCCCCVPRRGPAPLCDIPSGCCFFTGPWTVTRSSLRMLPRVAAFCRPLRLVLLLVSFTHSRSPVPPPSPPQRRGSRTSKHTASMPLTVLKPTRGASGELWPTNLTTPSQLPHPLGSWAQAKQLWQGWGREGKRHKARGCPHAQPLAAVYVGSSPLLPSCMAPGRCPAGTLSRERRGDVRVAINLHGPEPMRGRGAGGGV